MMLYHACATLPPGTVLSMAIRNPRKATHMAHNLVGTFSLVVI